jgi:hypothetical protein
MFNQSWNYVIDNQCSTVITLGTKSDVPKKDGWTKKDDMARKIQTVYRGYR